MCICEEKFRRNLNIMETFNLGIINGCSTKVLYIKYFLNLLHMCISVNKLL